MTEPSNSLLDRVRKLLAQAEDDAVTTAEAEAFTAKAAELMAKYGIDRALLAATQPDTDKPVDRQIDVDNPWGREKAHLLCALASALRCQAILLNRRDGCQRVHIFAFGSDIERLDLLYTSLLLQMSHGLARTSVPDWSSSPRAWRRSWLLGFCSAVVNRIKAAEASAVQEVKKTTPGTGAELVLADRSVVIGAALKAAYPTTRQRRVTYSGSGYRDGYEKGQKANIGGTSVGRRNAGALQ